MGPRSEDRGNSGDGTQHTTAERASMGPRSEDRGNAEEEEMELMDIMLQWGRDLKIAEMGFFATRVKSSAALQWGRDLKIAEMCRVDDQWMKVAIASMGPRSEDRGNALAREILLRYRRASNGAAI